jgi:glucose/arabinose dehydrogenase
VRWQLILAITLATACGSDTSIIPTAGDDSPPSDVTPPVSSLQSRTLATGLDTPWDLQIDPEGTIWVTERRGAISRVDTSNGEITPVRTVDEVVEISESGLLGMALHPDFAAEPFVYVVHSFNDGSGIKNRLIRMRWDGVVLGTAETLLDDIPGANNHNGTRLAFGPDGMLYITTGDSFDLSLPQNTSSLGGKILRLTPIDEPAPDNPFQNAVYSFGHRNPQGLVFHPVSGQLYSTDHGPSDNDEVNRIQQGRNYGWPNGHLVLSLPPRLRPVILSRQAKNPSEFCTAHFDLTPNGLETANKHSLEYSPMPPLA